MKQSKLLNLWAFKNIIEISQKEENIFQIYLILLIIYFYYEIYILYTLIFIL